MRTWIAVAFAAVCLTAAVASSAETDAERGRYLASTIMTCVNCHTPLGEAGPDMARQLAGGRRFEEDAFTVFASNITPDDGTGIGRWTEDAIEAAVLDGVRPDGTPLAPIMPSAYYRALRPSDTAALVDYLRTVKPIVNAVPAPDYRQQVHPTTIPAALATPPGEADLATPAGRGRYLVTIGRCMECHSRPGANGEADLTHGYGAGGAKFEGPWGVSIAANITSSPTAGLGRWTDAEVVRAITEGVGRDGRKLKPPMAFRAYAKMATGDVDDVVAYLRTVPAIE